MNVQDTMATLRVDEAIQRVDKATETRYSSTATATRYNPESRASWLPLHNERCNDGNSQHATATTSASGGHQHNSTQHKHNCIELPAVLCRHLLSLCLQLVALST